MLIKNSASGLIIMFNGDNFSKPVLLNVVYSLEIVSAKLGKCRGVKGLQSLSENLLDFYSCTEEFEALFVMLPFEF